ncbi:MAG: hypothetical protein M3R54_05970 [Chloroflexota bacterium]|nr:hypothetical protein [Chloroflexota bacterium]
MRTGVAAGIAVLAVLAAVGIGLAGGRVFAPSPTPHRVTVTFTPAPTPSPTPYDEAALFREPISGGCATQTSVWVITNGAGLLRYAYAEGKWAVADDTLRSLTRVRCTDDTVYAVGLVGAVVIANEQTRQIRARDITTEDLFGVSPSQVGAYIVGSHGAAFLFDPGSGGYQGGQIFDEDLLDVVAFNPDSAWAVGGHGITYRLDTRGWSPVGSGQGSTLRAVAGTTAANVIAVGDAGAIVTFTAGGWLTAKSGVDATLRDVIVAPGVWIAGDNGTLLTTSGVPATPFRKVDIGTTCDLVALFTRSNDIWVVGRSAAGGGVWRLRGDGTVQQHFGGC